MSEGASANILRRIDLNCRVPDRLGQFYAEVFDASVGSAYRQDATAAKQSTGVEIPVTTLELRIGDEPIALTRFDGATSSYPFPLAGSDTAFQHFAIVVSDMSAAYERLRRSKDWTAISSGGPQTLPQSSGGVVAFKFRDPEGHPLELLAFPADAGPERWRRPRGDRLFPGVDHSAVTVSDADASEAFYTRLGFTRRSSSLNIGPEQARLDGMSAPEVEVRGLGSTPEGTHIELLCYRAPPVRSTPTKDTDIAATRLVMAAPDRPTELLRDPDGHRIALPAV